YQAGNISEKENLRIHALLFSARAESIDQYNSILDTEKELHNLLNSQDSAFIVPVNPDVTPANIGLPPLQQAIDSCLANRPDILAASINHDRAQKELNYQQSLRYPDITVGPEYDRLNSYVPNYVGLGISLPLPIFNRNQGAIKAAKYSIGQSEIQLTQQQKQAEQELIAAYGKFNQAKAGLQMQDSLLGNQYQTMLEHMVDSYQHRQISLLELADFIQSYKELYQQQLALINNCYNAAAEINYAAASTLTRISTNTSK
ncbi:MAG TPA: TolC family protein, partial [Chitinophagaceae bacterium]|nr:TolC family protein [Chitinophagaceae bacterium]